MLPSGFMKSSISKYFPLLLQTKMYFDVNELGKNIRIQKTKDLKLCFGNYLYVLNLDHKFGSGAC